MKRIAIVFICASLTLLSCGCTNQTAPETQNTFGQNATAEGSDAKSGLSRINYRDHGMRYSLPGDWSCDSSSNWTSNTVEAYDNDNPKKGITLNFFDCQEQYKAVESLSEDPSTQLLDIRMMTVSSYLDGMKKSNLISGYEDTEICGHPAAIASSTVNGVINEIVQVLVSPTYSVQIVYKTDSTDEVEASMLLSEFLATISFDWNSLPE